MDRDDGMIGAGDFSHQHDDARFYLNLLFRQHDFVCECDLARFWVAIFDRRDVFPQASGFIASFDGKHDAALLPGSDFLACDLRRNAIASGFDFFDHDCLESLIDEGEVRREQRLHRDGIKPFMAHVGVKHQRRAIDTQGQRGSRPFTHRKYRCD